MKLWKSKRAVAALGGVLVVAVSSLLTVNARAATGQIYITPGSTSVLKDASTTVGIYINPGTSVDTVTISLSYDATKLQYVSTSYAGSPLNTQVGATATSGKISFTSVLLGNSINTTAVVANVTFTALAGSGTASLDLTGSNAAYQGTPTGPGLTGSTISLTSPATCPAGTTGTPPNCTSTTGGTGGTGTGGTGTGTGTGSTGTGSTGSTKPSGSTGSTPSGSSSGATSAGGATASGTPVTVQAPATQYTVASLSFTSKDPTQVYVRYGIGNQLTSTSPVSDFATTHAISLDPATLIPGQTYTYIVYSTNKQGVVSQTAPQTFKTKGLQVTVGVFDKNHKPIRGKSVVLHSDPQTAKTDDNGFATFTNVAPGDHRVIYEIGKKSYDQAVTVANNVQTVEGKQTSTPQNFSVVYGFVQPNSHTSLWVGVGIGVVVLIGLYALAQAGRLGFAAQLRGNRYAQPLTTQAVVVSNTTEPLPSSDTKTSTPQIDEARLSAIPDPSRPQPGSTVAPKPIVVDEIKSGEKQE